MSIDRRQFIIGTGIALAGAVGVGANVLADEHELPVVIAAVNPMEETVVLENIGNETVDLGGYQMDWEHNDDQDQTDTFDDGVTIEAGAQLVVWTGFQSDEIGEVDYDHQIADHGNGRINDTNPDVVAFLSPSGEVVATSDGEVQPPEPEPPEDGGGDDGGDEDGDDDGGDEEEDDGDEDGEDDGGEEEEEEADEEDGEETDEETDEDDC